MSFDTYTEALFWLFTPLTATGSVTASGSQTTADGWSKDANGDGSHVPTVTLDVSGTDETYLDVRHLSYLRLRADLDTDGAAWVYERLSASDDDNAAVSSDSVLAADGATTVYAASVEGISYVRVACDQSATVYAGGSA